MRPEQPPAQPTTNLERLAWMLRTLRAAVARACPSDLASLREDLVQVALVRVLEGIGPTLAGGPARTAADRGAHAVLSLLIDHLPQECLEKLRNHGRQNLPCGSPSFVEELGTTTGRTLKLRPRGRPSKGVENEMVSVPFLKR